MDASQQAMNLLNICMTKDISMVWMSERSNEIQDVHLGNKEEFSYVDG